MEYNVETERLLNDFDLEWAEYVAGRKISAEEAMELVRDYLEWVKTLEDNDVGPEIYAEAA